MAVDLGELKEMIEAALPGSSVEVSDEDGGGQHLRAVVTAPQFAGLSRIDQHRLVKAAINLGDNGPDQVQFGVGMNVGF